MIPMFEYSETAFTFSRTTATKVFYTVYFIAVCAIHNQVGQLLAVHLSPCNKVFLACMQS
jgi:hypothetical protein